MWQPSQLRTDGPRFLAIVAALSEDIEAGRLSPGDRLLPQRELSFRLGLSVGTVVRAYRLAEQRGLVSGEIGRGTYVRGAQTVDEGGFFGDGARSPTLGHPVEVDLSLNVPPVGSQASVLAGSLRALASAPDLEELLRYSPHQGRPHHRLAFSRWITRMTGGAFVPAEDRVVICNGAQHALALILMSVTSPGDAVLTEALTYAGIKAAAGACRVELHGIELDPEGPVVSALDAACERTGARVLYTMPTLQNPTGRTMSSERRTQVVDLAKRRGLTVIEDDVYGFLDANAPAPLASLIPDQTVYVGSFSKALAPGLRVGFAVAPPGGLDRMVAGIRAAGWMTAPIMVEVVARSIADGSADAVVAERRREARLRFKIAQDVLGPRIAPADTPSFQVWLPLADREVAANFVALALSAGIVVTPPQAVSVGPDAPAGVRLCLGAAPDAARLRMALERLRGILDAGNDQSLIYSIV